jgi:L-histidine Nalpha-methyltransferase
MRDKDLLLIEVAATKELDNQTIQAAAAEYAKIESFKKFVTSALLQNTDLHIDLGNLIFRPSVEENKAILIKVIYRNLTKETLRVMLPDWSYTDFLNTDLVSRK